MVLIWSKRSKTVRPTQFFVKFVAGVLLGPVAGAAVVLVLGVAARGLLLGVDALPHGLAGGGVGALGLRDAGDQEGSGEE